MNKLVFVILLILFIAGCTSHENNYSINNSVVDNKLFVCASDIDCNDSNETTMDQCINLTTPTYCLNTPCEGIICGDSCRILLDGMCCNNNYISLGECCSDSDCNNQVCLRNRCVNDPIRIGVIEFAPKNVIYGALYYCYNSIEGYYLQSIKEYCNNMIAEYSFLDVFNNPSGQLNVSELSSNYEIPKSIYYIKSFYENEAKRYGVNKQIINLSIKGPYTLTSIPNDNLTGFFINESIHNNVNLSEYDVVAFVYFNDYILSNRTYQGFRSHADYKYGLNNIETNRVFDYSGVYVIIHELAHNLGASDSYIEPCDRGNYWSCCLLPEGVPNPGVYPQTNACLMCGNTLELNERGESQATSLNNIIICNKTAEELEWI